MCFFVCSHSKLRQGYSKLVANYALAGRLPVDPVSA